MFAQRSPLRAVLALVLALPGCGASEPAVYRPELATVDVDGFPGTRYAVPPEGELRVASFGITEMTDATDAPPVATLHVRLVLENRSAVAWQVDTRAQLVEIPGEGRSAPLYVNGDAAPGPTAVVGARERHTLDLYFPLPASVSSSLELPRFDFLWQVQGARGVVAERTTFERAAAEDVAAYRRVLVVAGFGPWWWVNPWPAPAFRARPVDVAVHDPARPPVVIVPRPHRLYVGHPQPEARPRRR